MKDDRRNKCVMIFVSFEYALIRDDLDVDEQR